MPDQPQPKTPSDRPSNHEVENENQRPDTSDNDGPPRPATEPAGADDSTRSPKIRTDPGSGEQ